MPETQPGISQDITLPAERGVPTLPATKDPAATDSQSDASTEDVSASAGNQDSPPTSGQLTVPTGQRDASGPAVARASNSGSFDPMANGPQPPALEPRLAEVANIADPHLRQHVEANVRLQTQRQIAAFTDAQRQAKAQAKQVIDQGGDLSTIPASLMLQIDTPGRLALRDYVMAHGNPATDPATYYGLKNQALDDPAGFQAVDIANHMARLKPSDYADLQQLQTSLRNNQPPADLPLQQAYKANTDRMLQQLSLPTQANLDSATNDNVAGARQAALLRQAIDQHVAATEIATGRRMTPGEHLGLSAKISEQFQLSSADLQKSAAPEVTALNTKGILADDGENDNAKLLGKASTNGLPPDVADFNSNDIAAPTELKKLASSDDSPNLAECMAICEKLALPTYIRDGFPYWQCVQACMSGGKSGHRAWDKLF